MRPPPLAVTSAAVCRLHLDFSPSCTRLPKPLRVTSPPLNKVVQVDVQLYTNELYRQHCAADSSGRKRKFESMSGTQTACRTSQIPESAADQLKGCRSNQMHGETKP